MRVIAALLIFAVVCQSALAVTSKSQAKLMMEKVNNKLEKSHFGRALKGMVTIASKLGYDYDDLFDAFAALKAQLLQRLDNENELFDTQSAAHAAAVAQFNADISNYEGQITDGEAALNDLNSQLSDYQTNLANAQQALSDNQASLEQNQHNLDIVKQVYAAEVEDYQSAASVIAEAISHLQDAQASYDNASLGDFSLVQVKNTFISFAQKIQTATKNLKAKHQLYVKPVVQAMMQVKSSTNQTSIQVAIAALNDLASYFTQSLNDLTTIYVATVNQLESTIDALNQAIDIL